MLKPLLLCLVLASVAAAVHVLRRELDGPALVSTCESDPECPVEHVTVDLGGSVTARQPFACVLTAAGRISHCRPICSRGEAFDKSVADALHQRIYRPVLVGGVPSDRPYVFMVTAAGDAAEQCVPVQASERSAATSATGGLLTPTCERLETDRCVAEELELTDEAVGYEPTVIQRGVQGMGSASCTLGVAGEISGCVVRSQQGHREGVDLGAEVIRFLERRRYRPVTSGGTAVAVRYNFHLRISASPGSELRRIEPELIRTVVSEVNSRLFDRERASADSKGRVCVIAPDSISESGLRSVGDEFSLDPECGRLAGDSRYIHLRRPQRGVDGQIHVTVSAGWIESHGSEFIFSVKPSPLELTLVDDSEFVH